MKTIFITVFLFLLVCQVQGQDVIFKQSGERVQAVMIEKSGSDRSYKLFNARDNVIFHISTANIDSILYQDGSKETFPRRPATVIPPITEETRAIYHHLIGFDVLGALDNRLMFSYEYLPGKAMWGLKASWTKNNQAYDYWAGELLMINQSAKNYFHIGVNRYFFPQGTFRIGTGLGAVAGNYKQYNEGIQESGNFQGLLFTVFIFYNINKTLAANLGIDTQVVTNPRGRGSILFGQFLISL